MRSPLTHLTSVAAYHKDYYYVTDLVGLRVINLHIFLDL